MGRMAISSGIGRTASRTRLAERHVRAAARGTTLGPALHRSRSASHSIPTSTARSVRSSSQSISSSAKARLLWVAPELADPVGAIEVGKHEDAEKLGAGSGAEGVEALL
jgi:hypothetical protein